ncbi:MAG: response regulator transcription factor [Clostridiales bacterium]|jgi:DNA-binding response OmpR family regulator|nr:response regulator transcription factor [Clostridiales bacterium]
MRVLMIEDEVYIARAIAEVLRKNNYAVDLAHDGVYGLDCARAGIYDFILLDVMLPKLDGLSVLRQLRREGSETPVILLTAKDELSDKVAGLDSGADDYLPKPFHTDELLARLRALGRRPSDMRQGGWLSARDIELSPHKLILRRGAVEERLKLKEAQILELLMRNKNCILSKSTIIKKVWGFDTNANDNNVESHISLLRKKLSAIGSDNSIQTVRGVGYALVEGEAD